MVLTETSMKGMKLIKSLRHESAAFGVMKA